MPTISLTRFVDFVAASGTTRLSKVREVKRQYEAGYDVPMDFWKPFRDRVMKCAKHGWDPGELKRMLTEVQDSNKLEHYAQCESGLVKWVGKKKVTPLSSSSKVLWTSGDLTVRVNPEILVEDGDKKYVVKLHFKEEKLSKTKAEVILQLMRESMSTKHPLAVLDVRRSKLYPEAKQTKGIETLLRGEAALFSALWDAV